MNALILAAGEGRRAKQSYPNIPKALIPICGVPIARFLITTLDTPLLLEKEPVGNAGARNL